MKLYNEILIKMSKNISSKKSKNIPFSSIFSKAERALLVLTFPNISLTFVAVLKQHQTTFLVCIGTSYLERSLLK